MRERDSKVTHIQYYLKYRKRELDVEYTVSASKVWWPRSKRMSAYLSVKLVQDGKGN